MCALKFSDINYSVSHCRGKRKTILHDVSGHFPGGCLIAIMGPSGAGKSSLLNILTGFETHHFQGRIRINDVDRNLREFKKVSCYITQEDNLCDYLTVEENMIYAADFKIGPGESAQEKMFKVTDVLLSLGLFEQRKTITSRLSGGEKKRLSVAQELLSDPTFLFLDEPTTGLDSLACYQTMSELKNLTRHGKTVVCTIHQPSDSIFKLFDHVYVLAAGKCTYQGSVNNMITFFDKHSLPCGIYSNPADHMMELSSGDYGVEHIAQLTAAIENGRNLFYTLEEDIKMKPAVNEKVRFSMCYEFVTLCKWQFYKVRQNKSLVHQRVVSSTVATMLIGMLYFNAGNDATRMLHAYYMLLAFIIANTQPILMLTILHFPQERSVLKKELFNGYYRLHLYLVTNSIVEYPLTILCSILTSAVIFLMTGQILELKRYTLLCFGTLFVILLAQTLGNCIGSAVRLVNGIFLGSIALTPLMLLSGFGFMIKDLQWAVRYISNFAYLKYCLNASAAPLIGMDRGKWECPEQEYCLYMRGDLFFSDLGVDLYHYWYDILFLFAHYLLLKIATYYAMKTRLAR